MHVRSRPVIALLRAIGALAVIIAQVTTLGFTLADRPARDIAAHVEPAGVSVHQSHDEAACPSCLALQHFAAAPEAQTSLDLTRSGSARCSGTPAAAVHDAFGRLPDSRAPPLV